MRFSRFFHLLVFSVLFAQLSPARQVGTGDTQGVLVLRNALAAMAPSINLKDITLSGSVRRIAGADDESGEATMKATVSGQSRLDLSLPSGKLSESRDLSTPAPSGKWMSPDGAIHNIAYHNLVAEPLWCSPALVLSQALASTNTVVTNLGQEVRGGATVTHLVLSQAPSDSTDTAKLLQHLSQFDLFLDSSTFLPVSLVFNLHPDRNAL